MNYYLQYQVQTYTNEVIALTIDDNEIKEIKFSSEVETEEDYEPLVMEVGVESPTYQEVYTFKVYNILVEAPYDIHETLTCDDIKLNDDGLVNADLLMSENNVEYLSSLWEATVIGNEVE